MILQALYRHYGQLQKKGKVPESGWGTAKVSYALSINDKGELVTLIPLMKEAERGKKRVSVPETIKVPEQVKKASGVVSNFLCENSSYILGIDNKGKPERTAQCFQACRELHQELLGEVESDAARAVVRFFDNWDPETATEHPKLVEEYEELLKGGNLIFQYLGKNVQDDEEIKKAWMNRGESEAGSTVMRCLVTGEKAPIARLHPSVKGVRDAQSSGASLVSYNLPAYESYGKKQSYNAPVSEDAASAYTAALNYMLENSKYKYFIGGTTVLYWAEDAEPAYQEVMTNAMFQNTFDDKIRMSEGELKTILERIENNEEVDLDGEKIDPNCHFYMLGLAPNAARLSVRFFMENTFRNVIHNINEHNRRLEIVRPKYETFESIPLWRLLQETVNPNAKEKVASPLMTGSVFRAVLSDNPYPASLINNVMLRIRAEKNITYVKAAIIKAYYLKNGSEKNKEVLKVNLNEETNDLPYVLGRLFSVYEAIQEKSVSRPKPADSDTAGKKDSKAQINATIKDKYFNSAAANPALIFPVLQKLSTSHLKKIGRDHAPGNKIYFDKLLSELYGKIPMSAGPAFPAKLGLEEQGNFFLGYYHQTQKRYEKKQKEEA